MGGGETSWRRLSKINEEDVIRSCPVLGCRKMTAQGMNAEEKEKEKETYEQEHHEGEERSERSKSRLQMRRPPEKVRVEDRILISGDTGTFIKSDSVKLIDGSRGVILGFRNNGERVVLKKNGGKVISVPVSKLSRRESDDERASSINRSLGRSEDQKFSERVAKAREEKKAKLKQQHEDEATSTPSYTVPFTFFTVRNGPIKNKITGDVS